MTITARPQVDDRSLIPPQWNWSPKAYEWVSRTNLGLHMVSKSTLEQMRNLLDPKDEDRARKIARLEELMESVHHEVPPHTLPCARPNNFFEQDKNRDVLCYVGQPQALKKYTMFSPWVAGRVVQVEQPTERRLAEGASANLGVLFHRPIDPAVFKTGIPGCTRGLMGSFSTRTPAIIPAVEFWYLSRGFGFEELYVYSSGKEEAYYAEILRAIKNPQPLLWEDGSWK